MGNDDKEQQKRTVATAWALNFADIEKNSPASADLLRLSAFLAPDAIPLELFEKGATEMPQKLAAKLAEAADNPLVLDELLSPLLRFSLVRRDDEKRTYSIHPLVQEVVRDGLSKEDQRVLGGTVGADRQLVFSRIHSLSTGPTVIASCPMLWPAPDSSSHGA